MEKSEALRRWQLLDPDQEILTHFTPIPADAKGSTFGACGIRISGNPEFIDAVLSRLKDLLAAEAGSTRLSLSRQPVKTVAITTGDSVVEKKWNNADTNAETCYIQIRERTARTRTRKAREATRPLPNMDLPLDTHQNGENRPSKPSEPSSRTTATPASPSPSDGGKSAEPFARASVGSRNGEVIWEDDESEE